MILGDSKLEDHPHTVRRLLEAASDGQLSVEIHRVETWEPSRCSTLRPKPYYHLLRFPADGGDRELARAALQQTGLFAEFQPYPDPVSRPTPPTPADAQAVVRRALGPTARVESARLVTLGGLQTCYSPLDPCLAFTVDGRYYALEGKDRLYELLYPEEAMTVSELNATYMSSPRPLGWDPEAPVVVSVGHAWVRARRVPISGDG